MGSAKELKLGLVWVAATVRELAVKKGPKMAKVMEPS